MLTGLGLAGQPVDDDPDFGVVSLQVGGPQPLNPVFGGGLVVVNAVTDRIEGGLGT